MTDSLVDNLAWNADGLIPAIAQDHQTNEILMMAWMNKESLLLTIERRKAVYWSRSRQKLWQKGEQSGHEQIVHDIRLDCDNDTILLKVEQKGGIACHTGRRHCFFKQIKEGKWEAAEPIVKDPKSIYQ